MATSVRSEVSVLFRAHGVDAVRKAVRDLSKDTSEVAKQGRIVGSIGEGSLQRFGQAARVAAGGVEAIARTGKVSGEAMKQIVAQGAETALMFGAGGPIVGALGILGVAFFSAFKRARDEIKETQKQFDASVAEMINAGNSAGLMKQAQDLFVGTPAKNFEDGLRVLEARESEMLSRLNQTAGITHAAIKKQLDDFRKDTSIEEKRRQFEKLRQAILDIRNTPLVIRGAEPVKVAATVITPESQMQERADELFAQLQEIIAKHPLAKSAGNITRDSRFPQPDIASGARVAKLPPGFEGLGGGIESALRSARERMVDATATEIGLLREQVEAIIREHIEEGLRDSLVNGFRRAFSGEGLRGFFKGFGETILGSLGDVFVAVGKSLIKFGEIASAISKALATLGLASGPFAIVAGAALIALGVGMGAGAAGLGGRGGGGGGSGGGYSQPPQIIDRGVINPTLVNTAANVQVRQPITYAPTIIGPDDPKAWRDFAKFAKNARDAGHDL